jgi:hypothetical protein
MLHRVEKPQHTPLLRQVVEFEKGLLIFICNYPADFVLADKYTVVERPDFDSVQQVFQEQARNFLGQEIAEWLWQRTYEKENGECNLTTFGKTLKQALQYINQNPLAGSRILACAQNDLEFHQHFTDAGYSFHEQTTAADLITRADLMNFSPLFISLYKNIFCVSGFPALIHSDAAFGSLTRKDWNNNFWTSNRTINLCPACNGQKPDLVHSSQASDVDHFFPKEKYPFLSVHPENLIPICSTCNTNAKGTKDPINDHNTENLLDTFHPYYCPAIEHIQLSIRPDAGIGIQVTLQEQDGIRSRRIDNLVRVFDLETRWANWYEGFINTRIATMKYRSLSMPDQIREYLQIDLGDTQNLRETQEKCFVFANFLQYVLNDQQEFESLCESFGV